VSFDLDLKLNHAFKTISRLLRAHRPPCAFAILSLASLSATFAAFSTLFLTAFCGFVSGLGDPDTVPACDNIDSVLASFSSFVANAASFLAFVAVAFAATCLFSSKALS